MAAGDESIPDVTFQLSGASELAEMGEIVGMGHVLDAANRACASAGMTDYMENVAGLVFTSRGSSVEDLVIADFFVQAPNLVYWAFIRSKLPKIAGESVMGQIRTMRTIPYCLATADATSRMSVIVAEGKAAVKKHPEAAGLIEKTFRYAKEVSKDAQIGRAAVAGMCFSLSRLDAGWGRARNTAIDEAMRRQRLSEQDWSEISEWM